MSYIEQSLSSGETVLYRTRLHWIVMLSHLMLAAVIGCAGAALCFLGQRDGTSSGMPARLGMEPKTFVIVGLCMVGMAVIIVVVGFFKRSSTEMAVTNKRVLVKVGIMSRRSIEIMLSKIESVRVDQSVMGRIFGFGTIVVRGVGGTPEPFAEIAHPLELRRHIQEQIDRLQGDDAKTI